MANGFDVNAILAGNPYYLGPAGTSRDLPNFQQAAAEKTRMANPRLAAAMERGTPPPRGMNPPQQKPVPTSDPQQKYTSNPNPIFTTPGNEPPGGVNHNPPPPAPPVIEDAYDDSNPGMPAPTQGIGDIDFSSEAAFVTSLSRWISDGRTVPVSAISRVKAFFPNNAALIDATVRAAAGLPFTYSNPSTTPWRPVAEVVEDAPPPKYPGTPWRPVAEVVEDAPPPKYPGTPYEPPPTTTPAPPQPPADVEDAPAPEIPSQPAAAPQQQTAPPAAAAPGYKAVGLKMLNASRAPASAPAMAARTGAAPRVESASSYRDAGSRLAAKRTRDPFAVRR